MNTIPTSRTIFRRTNTTTNLIERPKERTGFVGLFALEKGDFVLESDFDMIKISLI